MFRFLARAAIVLSSVGIAGCGAQDHMTGAKYSPSTVAESNVATKGKYRADRAGGEAIDGINPVGLLIEAKPAEQKIIYTATIDLVVKDYSSVESQIRKMVKDFGGNIAEFREYRRTGDELSGHWVLRIPVARFDDFVGQVVDLGIPRDRQISSEDVSAEYVDISARLTNQRRLEERMLKLVDERTGNVADVIAAEAQLAKIREQIELYEGRLRYFDDRIEMTTVTITAQEDRSYTPPQTPTFSGRIGETFSGSIMALRKFGEFLVLAAVAIGPWLGVFLVVVVFPLWLLVRMLRRTRKTAA
jgi:hypothetical protein